MYPIVPARLPTWLRIMLVAGIALLLAAAGFAGGAFHWLMQPVLPQFAWEHVWRVGDLVLWDNRCTMHRRDAFDPKQRRIMHRTQVKGDARPV